MAQRGFRVEIAAAFNLMSRSVEEGRNGQLDGNSHYPKLFRRRKGAAHISLAQWLHLRKTDYGTGGLQGER